MQGIKIGLSREKAPLRRPHQSKPQGLTKKNLELLGSGR